MSAAPQPVLTPDQIVLKREHKRRQRRASNPLPSFRGTALEVQSVCEHEWISAGPAETGKTFSLLYRLDALMRSTPRASALIVRKVRADMNSTVLQTWRRIIALHGDVEVYGGEEAKFYSYPNGARVWVCGMDRPGAALSSDRDFIYVNQAEELSLEAWEYLSTRCTGRGAVTEYPMLFGDCNPGPPSHWILHRPALSVLHSKHTDNPTLFDDAGELTAQGQRTMAVLESLTGVRKERLYYGRWVAAEGTVYDAWDRGVHLLKRFPIPTSWRRVCVVDFGYTNPFVWQLWAIDDDGRAYLDRELYRTQRLVEDHAKDIKRITGGTVIELTIADHDAEDRATLERHGIPTIPAQKAITPGIQAVQSRLAKAGDGKPRLFVLEDALIERDEALAAAHKPVCTADEFEVYSWAKDATGRPVKEEPVKLHDHGMDATRYLVAYLDGLGETEAGWLDFIRADAEAARKRDEEDAA